MTNISLNGDTLKNAKRNLLLALQRNVNFDTQYRYIFLRQEKKNLKKNKLLFKKSNRSSS